MQCATQEGASSDAPSCCLPCPSGVLTLLFPAASELRFVVYNKLYANDMFFFEHKSHKSHELASGSALACRLAECKHPVGRTGVATCFRVFCAFCVLQKLREKDFRDNLRRLRAKKCSVLGLIGNTGRRHRIINTEEIPNKVECQIKTLL